jgi:cell division transport system permease protein
VKRVWVVLMILARSAVRGLQGAVVTAAIAVVTIAIALFLVGAFALTVVNMEGMLDRFGGNLQVTAYLDEGLEPAEEVAIAERVATIEGVARVAVVGRAEALERFRDIAGGAALLEGLEENPLPSSLEITLAPESRTTEGLRILAEALEGLPGIDEVAHGSDWIEGYARVTSLVRVSGYALGTVLCLATLLIVANTIRLGVYAREDELEILALVGASRTFVRTPFLMEGTLQGAIGGLLAAALLWVAFLVLVPQLEYGLTFLLGNSVPRFFDWRELGMLVLGGSALGLAGSLAALFGWKP